VEGKMKIAIDAMGGDHAPEQPVKGAVDALEHISCEVVLIGDETQINNELKKYNYDASRVSVVHTTEVVTSEDKPVRAIKTKKDSSMVVGLLSLKDKTYDGFISAGNTGALLAGGLLRVGRIKGIDRPALCSFYPTRTGMSILADAGANADCKPRNLKEFGIMGSLYAQNVLGIDNPRVGLANIGHEEGKGNALVIEAFDMLKEANLNFIGNVEARDIPEGATDVIVCDGFTGNIILKLSEGVAKSFSSMIKEIFMKSPLTKVAALLVKSGLGDMKKSMDYTEYGGAPLLGVNGLVVKAHGSSNAKAFMNAIRYAEKTAASGVIEKIAAEVKVS